MHSPHLASLDAGAAAIAGVSVEARKKRDWTYIMLVFEPSISPQSVNCEVFVKQGRKVQILSGISTAFILCEGARVDAKTDAW
jgi:hypothetical protein